jgi:hypothetical protein
MYQSQASLPTPDQRTFVLSKLLLHIVAQRNLLYASAIERTTPLRKATDRLSKRQAE